jgi:phosphatidylglycerophosphate synthase
MLRPAMLTLPNILTLSRIVAVPLLVGLLWWPDWPMGYGLGFAMYCLMGITDYFDGYLARAQGRSRSWGFSSTPSPTRSWSRRSSWCWPRVA